MNPGPVEEAGETARTLIGNLKDSPMTLAAVVFNVLFVVIVYLSVRDQRDHFDKFVDSIFAQQKQTMEMLYNCTPTKQGT